MRRAQMAFFCLTMATVNSSMAQAVTNVVASLEGEVIAISYDLSGNTGESYDVRLYMSRDGGKTFSENPKQLSGAVNRWEAPGSGKTISWDAKKDLGEFEGSLRFKVIATGKGGATGAVSTSPSVISVGTSSSATGSAVTENELIHFTITGVFNVPDGIKVLFKMRAKKDVDVSLSSATQGQDQFGNVYTIVSSDIEGLGVLNGKARKFIAGAKKDGELILKISKMNGATLNGRMLKALTVETSAGTLVLNEIPRI